MINPSFSTLLSFVLSMSSQKTHNELTIAVGSKNPVKCNAVLRGYNQVACFFPPLGGMNTATAPKIEGIEVPSGVSDQPMSDEETQKGAQNRAMSAYAAYQELYGVAPFLAVGLEGGVSVDTNNVMECFAWIYCYDGTRTGASRTASFPLPSVIRDLVLTGMELGHADDKVV